MLNRFIGWAHSVETVQTKLHGDIEMQLTESDPSDNRSVRLDVDTPTAVGRITCWESGDYDAEAIDLQTERALYTDPRDLARGRRDVEEVFPVLRGTGNSAMNEGLHKDHSP